MEHDPCVVYALTYVCMLVHHSQHGDLTAQDVVAGSIAWLCKLL